MRFCTHCGKLLSPSSRFCSSCGNQTAPTPGILSEPIPTASGREANHLHPVECNARSAASFGQRAGAWVIDLAVLLPLYLAAGGLWNYATPEYEDPSFAGQLFAVLIYLLAFAYRAFFEGREAGQTFGKRALGIRVVREEGGAPLGYWRALGRKAARTFFFWFFWIGYLWPLWDPKRQALHDKVARTVVVITAAQPVMNWPGNGSWSGAGLAHPGRPLTRI